jgi:nitrate/nitrite transporter NarK
VKEVGIGAGMFGGAGYLLNLVAIGLMLTAIFALATAMDAWLAALLVTLVLLAVAGALATKGKKKIQNAGPPVPEQTIESVKQTIDTVKEETRWGLNQTR